MTEGMFFILFASITLLAVVMLILQSNPLASALYLVVALFGLACLYVLLSATFVAILQILVYAGAVMVLFVFVIMLLDLKKDDLIQDRIPKTKAILLGMLILVTSGAVFFASSFPKVAPKEISDGFGQAAPVGQLMFTSYLVPFELTSLLLLVAIIGAVFLGRKHLKEAPPK